MKKIIALVFALCLCLSFAAPAPAASYYISGVVNWPNCTEYTPCQPVLDTLYDDGGCTERDVVANLDTHGWVFLRVECEDYSVFTENSQIDMLPVFPFDAKMSALYSTAKTALDAILVKWSISASCSGNEAYRDTIRCIGQTINATWMETGWGN